MTMQNNIDIIGRFVGRNVLKTKSLAAAHKIDNQRPVEVGVAISARDCDPRTDCAQFIQNPFRANITQMPDLIRVFCKIDNLLRQLVMRIGQNKYFHGGSASPKTMLKVQLRCLK